MWKTLVVFVVCLVTVCCVWGLNDRLHYEGFKTAIEYVDGSVDIVIDDLSAVSAFAFAIDNFNPGSHDNSIYVRGRYITLEFAGQAEVFEFSSSSQALKISRVLNPMVIQANLGEGILGEFIPLLNAIFFWMSVIASVIIFLVVIILDIVGVAWGVIKALLYLIGIGSLEVAQKPTPI